jgi:hypothetical protein
MFKRFKRIPRHTHDWELVAVNDNYYTEFSDTGQKVYWQMRFYKCSCGERTASDNVTAYSVHNGVKKAKKNWIEAGVVPKNSYHPAESTHFVRIDDIEKEELDPVLQYQRTLNELVNSLGVVINRDFDLEAQYPGLKAAADEYHRQLDKYRNFESLKEDKNDS